MFPSSVFCLWLSQAPVHVKTKSVMSNCADEGLGLVMPAAVVVATSWYSCPERSIDNVENDAFPPETGTGLAGCVRVAPLGLKPKPSAMDATAWGTSTASGAGALSTETSTSGAPVS
ncbi:MAG: hypothetical protein E6G46_04750 [Actinobacteria bacterium]|nr:MAG: hypothetical protein E6G46_04750 [Actinomycetota bacterium]